MHYYKIKKEGEAKNARDARSPTVFVSENERRKEGTYASQGNKEICPCPEFY